MTLSIQERLAPLPLLIWNPPTWPWLAAVPEKPTVRGTVSGLPRSISHERPHQSHSLQETRQLEVSFPMQKPQEASHT